MTEVVQHRTATLSQQGFRYVFEDGCRYTWRHASELKPGTIDCSDMGDEEFARFVAEHPGTGELS